MRSAPLLALLLLVAGLAGCTSGDGQNDNTPGDGQMHVDTAPKVNASAMLDDLKVWAEANHIRRNNEPTHLTARDELADMFAEAGLEVWRQNFTNGIDQENIVGIKWGDDRNTWVVVGAHYDTVTDDCVVQGVVMANPAACPLQDASQGMYDDGSGTMMTVHLAEAYANISTPYTIAFVAFDGEERGTQGSGAFVEQWLDGSWPYEGVAIAAMLDLDMIGLNWPAVNAPINFIDNDAALQDEMRLIAAELGIPEDMVVYKSGLTLGSSDYRHFWNNDIPAAFLIADFEEVAAPYQPAPTPTGAYPFWHFSDTWETMVLMGGGDVETMTTGFQMALDVSTELLWFMAVEQPGGHSEHVS